MDETDITKILEQGNIVRISLDGAHVHCIHCGKELPICTNLSHGHNTCEQCNCKEKRGVL